MADVRRVTGDFAVAGQLEPGDLGDLKAVGFQNIINNRPDEEAPDGAKSTDMRAAAAAAGLTYVHAPFVGQPTPEAVEAAAKAVGPTLAYCRSGTRSTTAWALAQAKTGAMSAEDIVQAAAGAGYNISGLKETLRRLGAK